MNSSYEDVRTDDNLLSWALKSSHTHTWREPVKTKPADKNIRATTENQEENSTSVTALSFSSWDVSLCSANAVDSTLILFLSPGDYLQIVVVNRPLCSEQEFPVFVNFSHGRVTRVSGYYVRPSDTIINMFKHVVVQMSI